MNEPKPILVIKIPKNYTEQDYKSFTKGIDNLPISKEYHVLIIKSMELKEVVVEVFYSKDIQETNIQELEKMIKESWVG